MRFSNSSFPLALSSCLFFRFTAAAGTRGFFRFCRRLFDFGLFDFRFVDDFGALRIRFDRLDRVHAACERFVTFADGDDLSVRRFEAEAEFAALVFIRFVLCAFDVNAVFICKVFDIGSRIPLNACDTVFARFFRRLHFGCCND